MNKEVRNARIKSINGQIKYYENYISKIKFFESDWIDQSFYEDELSSTAYVLNNLRNQKREIERSNENSSPEFCIDCGERISEKRKNAKPWAVMCTDCSSEYERIHQDLAS